MGAVLLVRGCWQQKLQAVANPLVKLPDTAVSGHLLRCRHTWHSLEYIFGFLLMTTWVNPVLLILSLAANEQTLPGGAGAPYSSSSSSGKQDLAPHPVR